MRRFLPIIFIIIAIVIFVWYINPTFADIKELSAERDKFDEALDRSKELVAVRDALLSRYNGFSGAELEKLERILPDNVDNVRFILEVDNVAAKYGMAIRGINIGEVEVGENSADALATGSGDLGSIQLEFSVKSSYENFVQFLMDLEESLRIIDITAISFASEDDNLSTYSISLRIFWLKS